LSCSEHVLLGDKSTLVDKNQTITVKEDQTTKVTKNQTTEVGENKTTNVGKVYTLTAKDEIKLVTGSSSLTMKSDGTIVLKGIDISVLGEGEIHTKATKNLVMKGKKILEN